MCAIIRGFKGVIIDVHGQTDGDNKGISTKHTTNTKQDNQHPDTTDNTRNKQRNQAPFVLACCVFVGLFVVCLCLLFCLLFCVVFLCFSTMFCNPTKF